MAVISEKPTIDPKTLTINSHVEYRGERTKVVEIGRSIIGADLSLLDADGMIVYNKVPHYEVEPIAITPELLTELGFKWRKSAGSWCISDKKHGYFYATICSDSTCIVTHYPKFGFQSRVVCTYLHELEAFAYLIAKTELIPD